MQTISSAHTPFFLKNLTQILTYKNHDQKRIELNIYKMRMREDQPAVHLANGGLPPGTQIYEAQTWATQITRWIYGQEYWYATDGTPPVIPNDLLGANIIAQPNTIGWTPYQSPGLLKKLKIIRQFRRTLAPGGVLRLKLRKKGPTRVSVTELQDNYNWKADTSLDAMAPGLTSITAHRGSIVWLVVAKGTLGDDRATNVGSLSDGTRIRHTGVYHLSSQRHITFDYCFGNDTTKMTQYVQGPAWNGNAPLTVEKTNAGYY